jgi:phage/plasmid-associated DNA primase
MIDETTIDKVHAIEKLKSLATAKTISVSQKFVSHYSVPFFGKIILCTNKESDFMRIDEEEIRFWVRKIKPINGKKNTNIETDLFNEIPNFLKYLLQIEEIDFSKSRMVFTKDEIETESLELVKEESKSWLRKEIEYLFIDFFDNNNAIDFVEVTPKDIKERWFINNNQISISYIRKVLKEEMKMHSLVTKRYKGFPNEAGLTFDKVGLPFVFTNPYRVYNEQVTVESEEF